MPEYENVIYETLDDGAIARIWLNRPEYRNAQNAALLDDLNAAFLHAEEDPDVKVVILAGKGVSFSSGHDLGTPGSRSGGPQAKYGATEGTHLRWNNEWQRFFSYTQRWRDLRKTTVAQVHGACVAAGMMIAWACDLIVASDDAIFAEVTGPRLNMCAVEWVSHPWVFGTRRAKEMMLLGDFMDAHEAYRLGMVNRVFPHESMEEETLNYARRIARLPLATALMIKETVNQTQDIQGYTNALKASFSIHQMNHAHWAESGQMRPAAIAPRGQVRPGVQGVGYEPLRPFDAGASGYKPELDVTGAGREPAPAASS
jgi:enoyl-CoA hydratase